MRSKNRSGTAPKSPRSTDRPAITLSTAQPDHMAHPVGAAYANAIKSNSIKAFRALLQQDPSNASLRDNDGRTLLHWAAAEDPKGDVVNALFDAGADVNARDDRRRTPLFAVRNPTTTQLLLEHNDVDVHLVDKSGDTALHSIIRESLQSYIGVGAGYAFQRDHVLLIVDVFLASNRTDVNSLNDLRLTPLLAAISKDPVRRENEILQREIIGRLLACPRVNANARNQAGRTALHISCNKGLATISQIILENPAVDVNAIDNHKSGALHLACDQWKEDASGKKSYPAIVRILCERKANLEMRDDKFRTPLHLALDKANTELVSILLSHGANPNALDKAGMTPLALLPTNPYANERSNLADLLEKHGGRIKFSRAQHAWSGFKCELGFHSWLGCKCRTCRRIRDIGHDYSQDCEKCNNCGNTRHNAHCWTFDCAKCSNCGKTRASAHSWKNGVCSKCGMMFETWQSRISGLPVTMGDIHDRISGRGIRKDFDL